MVSTIEVCKASATTTTTTPPMFSPSSSSPTSSVTTTNPPMFSPIGLHLRLLLYSMCRCLKRWQPKTKITIINNPKHPSSLKTNSHTDLVQTRPVRIVTFNAAMFSMAPMVGTKAPNERPTKGILKHSSSKRRVLINLSKDKISVERSKGKGVTVSCGSNGYSWRFSERSVLDVLKEAGADVIALQNVKVEEERGMRPLSELAKGLGMRFMFTESSVPEYENAILSRL
ncbi:uncharacterized protein A4U43_C01F12650 [Asparagus officinalis]|uniref:Endonuclease/exonuclease/phosphatase domain-containing protein n=1 Tax=Asparagus officinalis TaxID=4686 RepID=A0A5P1FRE0_ASPOF|nr:uncharacterized protein A4U43_C01F12650 [Asparagus officinalis]